MADVWLTRSASNDLAEIFYKALETNGTAYAQDLLNKMEVAIKRTSNAEEFGKSAPKELQEIGLDAGVYETSLADVRVIFQTREGRAEVLLITDQGASVSHSLERRLLGTDVLE